MFSGLNGDGLDSDITDNTELSSFSFLSNNVGDEGDAGEGETANTIIEEENDHSSSSFSFMGTSSSTNSDDNFDTRNNIDALLSSSSEFGFLNLNAESLPAEIHPTNPTETVITSDEILLNKVASSSKNVFLMNIFFVFVFVFLTHFC